MRYLGYTHYFPLRLAWLWKLVCCRAGWHLWDEVWSSERHDLHCDACGVVLKLG